MDINEKSMRWTSAIWGLLAGFLTVVLWLLCLPPFNFPEAAYIAFVPLLLWLYSKPSGKVFWWISLGVGWSSWLLILIWLRHVTWLGTIALSGILAGIFMLWVAAARCMVFRLAGRGLFLRMLGFLGLAGVWVVLEWTRTWLLWGFPWAPLSLSQWERPVVLQISAWTGAYGVSFLLIFFNCCVAQTLWQRVASREGRRWMSWFSPDLYLGMAGLGLCLYLFFQSLPRPDSVRELFTAGVVQPYIPPDQKWDSAREMENLEILERQTRFVASLENDLVLWPEAAAPWPVIGYLEMTGRVLRLTQEIGKPILMGALAYEKSSELWYNGVALSYPEPPRMTEVFYKKRELVPFGEYVPWPFDRIVEKFVPLEGSFEPGESADLIELKINGHSLKVGSLVCYEDIFPALARQSVQAGAQVLFVATNNAWYGEEGGAEQHAAHSVLRAVETRRPVMRCGNGGWSGFIDAYGSVREVLFDQHGSIYFRGGGSYKVRHYEDWMRQQSFYTRHGDWFVALCGVFALLGGILAFVSPREPKPFTSIHQRG